MVFVGGLMVVIVFASCPLVAQYVLISNLWGRSLGWYLLVLRLATTQRHKHQSGLSWELLPEEIRAYPLQFIQQLEQGPPKGTPTSACVGLSIACIWQVTCERSQTQSRNFNCHSWLGKTIRSMSEANTIILDLKTNWPHYGLHWLIAPAIFRAKSPSISGIHLYQNWCNEQSYPHTTQLPPQAT